jgi:hypothetical protein
VPASAEQHVRLDEIVGGRDQHGVTRVLGCSCRDAKSLDACEDMGCGRMIVTAEARRAAAA